MALHDEIIAIRCELQKKNLKKSGKNKFAGFEYFELSDFLPTLNELMLAHGVNDIFTIVDGNAELILVKGEETQTYKIPFERFQTPLNSKGQPSMQDIQYLGALNTYYKRYCYLNAFGITDGEVIDAMDNSTLSAKADNAKKAEAKQAMDLPIGVEEAKTLENLIRNAKGDSPYEERLEMCLKKVGAADIADLKQSQYNYLVGILMKGQK